mmetsp:Transcript_8374/g.21941  ORF Transcript_8374/g.21941 Transcript_8374/m.21941 type:complete len:207 (+) Transcript_8374:258-878(+)
MWTQLLRRLLGWLSHCRPGERPCVCSREVPATQVCTAYHGRYLGSCARCVRTAPAARDGPSSVCELQHTALRMPERRMRPSRCPRQRGHPTGADPVRVRHFVLRHMRRSSTLASLVRAEEAVERNPAPVAGRGAHPAHDEAVPLLRRAHCARRRLHAYQLHPVRGRVVLVLWTARPWSPSRLRVQPHTRPELAVRPGRPQSSRWLA